MRLLILLTAIILVNGCTTVKYVTTPLTMPDPIVLPKIDGAGMQCLSEATYATLVQRDRLQTARRNTLREIISSTHQAKP